MSKPPSYILLLAELVATLRAASYYVNPHFPEVKKSFDERVKQLLQIKGLDITPAEIAKGISDLQEYEKAKTIQGGQ